MKGAKLKFNLAKQISESLITAIKHKDDIKKGLAHIDEKLAIISSAIKQLKVKK